MKLLLFAIAATAIAGLAIYLWLREKAKRNQERGVYQRVIDAKEKELQQHKHAIKAMEEVSQRAAKKKREIRKHSDPADRANAATNVMSDLARGDRKDGTSSAD